MTALKLVTGLLVIAFSQVLNIQGAGRDDLGMVAFGLAGTLFGLWIVYRAFRDAP